MQILQMSQTVSHIILLEYLVHVPAEDGRLGTGQIGVHGVMIEREASQPVADVACGRCGDGAACDYRGTAYVIPWHKCWGLGSGGAT